jgi:peptidoglycan/LPS O-acetylase OafA/YrhL
MNAVGIESGPLYAVSVVFLLAMSFVIAYLMWRWIEEPARVRMRSWIGMRPKPTEEAGESIVVAEQDAGVGPTTASPISVPDKESN